jgi:putative redox protein
MNANVKWLGDDRFMGTSASGHTLVLDANDGELAPSPMESVLISLGSCSSVDVVSILNKAKQKITGCSVELSGTRAITIPALFTNIHLRFIITGTDISVKHVNRAVTLSAEKYCSVALMLNKNVQITHSFDINPG